MHILLIVNLHIVNRYLQMYPGNELPAARGGRKAAKTAVKTPKQTQYQK